MRTETWPSLAKSPMLNMTSPSCALTPCQGQARLSSSAGATSCAGGIAGHVQRADCGGLAQTGNFDREAGAAFDPEPGVDPDGPDPARPGERCLALGSGAAG